ncbi:DUF2786 domain-containing protein [Nocardioides sp. LHD-245]|uniref:DUF2786 domain-containing protein n=1 Tax=Nocardioides sp. LHD-245 TaxID=3051387 RepID=UPI0027DFDEA5|nr:DUF2786 domain-containing protein [Nocardioides sp. LHD-245]
MAGDRYDARAAREVWQRLLWRPAGTRRVPTVDADRLAAFSVSIVDPMAERVLLQAVASAYGLGWQPAEVVHVVARRVGRVGGRLVDLAIAAEHDRRPGAVDPRWQAQVDALLARAESTRVDWLRHWRRREDIARPRCYDAAADVWRALARLPRLPVLIPPPGADLAVVEVASPAGPAGADPALDRIRKLLAKAESTAFEAEAEALTAKAQELMARHAVDRARLLGPAPDDGPRMIRILLEPPYAAAKGVLLAAVAHANRCRSVELGGLDIAAVVGHAEDLATVEILFTSLLVQAGNALAAAAHDAGSGERPRSAAFRQSFHLGFAARIRERLVAVGAEVLADPGASVALPVLRSRSAAVEEEFDRLFAGRLRDRNVGGRHDAWGAAQGRSAADRAHLRAGELSA